MPSPRFSQSVRSAGRGPGAGPSPPGPGSSSYTTREVVTGQAGNAYYVGASSAPVPARGSLHAQVGDLVTVQWRDGKPVMVLDYQVNRGGTDDVPAQRGPLIEELLVVADPKTKVLDVFFRNRDQLTALKLTGKVALIAKAQFGSLTPVVRWGQSKDRFVLFGTRTNDPQEISTTLIFVFKVNRPGRRSVVPTGTAVRATLLKEYTIAPLFPESDIPRQSADLFVDDRGHLLMRKLNPAAGGGSQIFDVEDSSLVYEAEPHVTVDPLLFIDGALTRWVEDRRPRELVTIPAHGEIIVHDVRLTPDFFAEAPADPFWTSVSIVVTGTVESPPGTFTISRTFNGLTPAQMPVNWTATFSFSIPPAASFQFDAQVGASLHVRGVDVTEFTFFSLSIPFTTLAAYQQADDYAPTVRRLPDWQASGGLLYVQHSKFDNDPHSYQMTFLDLKTSKTHVLGPALQFGPLFVFPFAPTEAHRLRFMHPGFFYTSKVGEEFVVKARGAENAFTLTAANFKKDARVGVLGMVKKLPAGMVEPPDFNEDTFSSATMRAKAYQAINDLGFFKRTKDEGPPKA